MPEREQYIPGLEPATVEAPELNMEQQEKPLVVRVVVSRSKSLDALRKELTEKATNAAKMTDVMSGLRLSGMKWIEKDETSVNPGQVMPIGGNVEKGETLEEASERELLEETHLRAINYKMLGEMDYDFWHKEKKQILQRHAVFMSAEIAPGDFAYPINPRVDKIKTTHDFDLDRTKELFEKGKIQATETSSVDLLDSLTDANGQPIKEVIMRDLEQKEAAKKTKVLRTLLALMKKSGELPKEAVNAFWFKQIEACWYKNKESGRMFADFQALERVWGEFWKIFGNDKAVLNLFWQAVDLSNFEEEIEGERTGVSKLEGQMHLMMTFLESRFKNDQYLEIAAKNPNLKEMVGKLKKFLRKFGEKGKGVTFEDRLEALGQAFSESAESRKKVIEKFLDVFGLDESEVPGLMGMIDDFLSSMHRQSIKMNVEETVGEKKVIETLEYKFADQLDELKGQSLDKMGLLLAAAFPTGRASIKAAFGGLEGDEEGWREAFRSYGNKEEKREHLRSFSFEARRKLALMILYKPFIEYYNKIRSLSSSELMQSEVYGHFTKQPVAKSDVKYDYDKEGNVIDSKVVIGPQVPGQPDLRRTNDKKYFLKMEHADPKELNSFLRKMIVRGWDDPQEVTDVFRRSIVLAGTCDEKDTQKLYTRVKRDMSGYAGRLFDDKEKPLQSINEVESVADVLEDILKSNPNAKITKYKATPKRGEKISSSGPGGGARLRFAKCTVELEKDGVVHKEELQIFSSSKDKSSGKVQSAFFYRKEKELDDSKYKQKRLFDTNTFRSFVELLYPAAIYGPAVRVLVARMKGK